MKATCMGVTVEGTPREIWELIQAIEESRKAQAQPFKLPLPTNGTINVGWPLI